MEEKQTLTKLDENLIKLLKDENCIEEYGDEIIMTNILDAKKIDQMIDLLNFNKEYNITELSPQEQQEKLDTIRKEIKFLSYAKEHCSNASSDFIVPNGVNNIYPEAFNPNLSNQLEPTTLKKVTLPDSITELVLLTFRGNEGLEEIKFPKNLEQIPSMICEACPNLKKVTLPENATTIGDYAFGDCKKLTQISLPSTVTNIMEHAFDNTGLTALTIPKNVTNIGEYAFANTKLKEVTIPQSITTIEKCAFANTKLENVTIPQSVTAIGEAAFGISTLKRVDFEGIVQDLHPAAFAEISYRDNGDLMGIKKPKRNIYVNKINPKFRVRLEQNGGIVHENKSNKTVEKMNGLKEKIANALHFNKNEDKNENQKENEKTTTEEHQR